MHSVVEKKTNIPGDRVLSAVIIDESPYSRNLVEDAGRDKIIDCLSYGHVRNIELFRQFPLTRKLVNDFTGANVVKINITADVIEAEVLLKTSNALTFRWNELSLGDIEIGDNVKADDIPYFKATGEKNLIPPDIDKKKKTKYGDAYSGLEFFKGDIQ